MTRPRMMLLTPDFPPAVGGIQRLLGAVTEHLSDEWDVTVVAPADSGGQTPRAAARARVMRTRASWGGCGSALVLAEMALIAATRRAELLVAGHVTCLPVAIAARPGGPIALWVYGSELWSPAGRTVLRRCAPRVTRVLAISRFTAEQAARGGIARTRIRLCPPGIEPLGAHPDRVDVSALAALGLVDGNGRVRPYIVTVARLVNPHKGHELLLQTWPAVHARHPGARCVIVGSGPLRERFARVSRAAGGDDSVVWAGGLDEPLKQLVLLHARALVMASTVEPAAAEFEGFGLTYLEAAQLGRPSIAANVAGPAEVVQDGVTGLLVEPGDAISLLEAADRLLGDPGLASRLGREARARVQRTGMWADRLPAIRAALAEAAA